MTHEFFNDQKSVLKVNIEIIKPTQNLQHTEYVYLINYFKNNLNSKKN
jgi:hypothetical protein